MATDVHDRERSLQREIARTVEAGLPAVEVLAVELSGPERFCVYVDHPAGVDHALCARVTDRAARLPRPLHGRRVLAGHRAPAAHAGALRRTSSAARSRCAPPTTIDGRKRFRGELVAAGDGRGHRPDGRGRRFEIPYDAIVRGNLIDEG